MAVDIQKIKDQVLRYSDQLERVKAEVRNVLVGQDAMLSRLLIALLTGEHVLLEGVLPPAHHFPQRRVARRLS